MKFLSRITLTIAFLNVFNLCLAQTSKKVAAKPAAKGAVNSAMPSLKSGLDSVSYAIGLNIAENIKNQKLEYNPDILATALKDVKAGKKTIMTNEQANVFIGAYFQKQAAKAGEASKLKGDAFLAKNKKEPGVVTLPSGLQYKIITAGTGAIPVATDKVKVHYHGTTIDGKVFDSSVNRGEPATFGVTQVIKGWVEALQLMPVGSKWTLYIPSDLAYGNQAPPNIGPGQVLIFDVELLSIEK